MNAFIRINFFFAIFLLITSGNIFPQAATQIAPLVSGTVSSGGIATINGEFNAQAPNITQIINDYNGSVTNYDTASSKFQTVMNQVYSSIGTDVSGFLSNSKGSIDAILAKDFVKFIEGFGKYYGQAILLTSHLTYPVGYDRIVKSPGLTLGFGGGTAFTNITGIKNGMTGDSSSMFGSLNVLPALALSLNGGIGITDRWSVRFSIFPTTSIVLPTSAAQLQNYDLNFKYGDYKARVSYVLLEDKKFSPGISLSGFLGYTTGELTVKTKANSLAPVSSTIATPAKFALQITPSYDAEAICSWTDFTVGPEIRFWYNLGFLFPYIGYGIGFQTGLVTTTFNFNTNMLIEESSTATLADGKKLISTHSQTVTSVSTIKNQSVGAYYLNRIMLGLEINIVMVRINAEVTFDPVTSMMGASAGANFAF